MGKKWTHEGPVALIWEPWEFSKIVLGRIDPVDSYVIFDHRRSLYEAMSDFGVPSCSFDTIAKLKQKSYRITIEEIEDVGQNNDKEISQ